MDGDPFPDDDGFLADGFVVPVRFMNPHSPLGSIYQSTLRVVTVLDAHTNRTSKELQLRDDDGRVAWRVANVGMMEMQDTGELLIYNSTSLPNHVVWRSSEEQLATDTLFQWQMLKPGMELHSPNSAYMARMETGGLVLYVMSIDFITQQPAPYWIFPVLIPVAKTAIFPNLNTLVLSSPCSVPDDLTTSYSRLSNSTWELCLHPGSCTDQYSCINAHDTDGLTVETAELDSWSFLRLEDDGRLHVYHVVTHPSLSILEYALDAEDASYSIATPSNSEYYSITSRASDQLPVFSWGACDVPMACGPLGLCTPDASSLCTCPTGLDPLNTTAFSEGCIHKPSSMLPLSCDQKGMDRSVTTTQYMQLNKTATIFLFNGWEFEATTASVETCKNLCALNCSCTGFFYQIDVSACFFMTDKLSLLNLVDDKNLTSPLYLNYFKHDVRPYTLIVASNYAAYIKVTVLGTKMHHRHVIIPISITTSIAILVLLGMVAYCIDRARRIKHSKQESAKEEEELQNVLPLLPGRFTYKELSEATKKFGTLLGEGGCGSVYLGTLPGGRNVAVKVLELSSLKGQTKQFLAELATIGSTSHQHVVHLVGFCWDSLHRLLVYEYVERGSLDRWLFTDSTGRTAGENIHEIKGNSKSEAASNACDTPIVHPDNMFHEWRTRYNIARGIARGLSYLHEECPQPILHFDIKPQNILLDNAFVPKLADFGMSRFIQRDASRVVTGGRGTPGYMAPEWVSQGAVGKKSDLYSMGMVMLEMVGGRRNFDLAKLCREADADHNNNMMEDDHLQGAWHFPSWAAKKCDEGLMMEMVDSRLRNVDEEQLRRLVYTAFWCIMEDPKTRPSATMVVQWLEGNSAVKRPPLSSIIRAGIAAASSSQSYIAS